MIEDLTYVNSYASVLLEWTLLNPANYNGIRVYRIISETEKILLATLTTADVNYAYNVPLADRGMIIQFGVAPFIIDDVDIALITVTTIPSSVSNLTAVGLLNEVVLKWDKPLMNSNIQGFTIERDLNHVAIAATGKYTEIGNFFKAPTAGQNYVYKVATITYDGVVSDYESVNVTLPSQVDSVDMLLNKQVSVNNQGKYRICSVSDNNERSKWITFQQVMMASNNSPDELKFRIRAVTTDGVYSSSVEHRSIVVPHSFVPLNPTFRLRIIDVDGLESKAFVTTMQNLLQPQP